MFKRSLSQKLAVTATVLTCILSFSCTQPARAAVQRTDNGALSRKLGIPLYEWQDDNNRDPKLIFLAIHGFTQQGGCFDVLARSLAARGYLVVAPDLRGHGRWLGSTGSTNNDFTISCDDESRLLVQLRKNHPKAKIFGLGESAGCAVLLRAVANEPKSVKGIILCAAGVEPHIHKPGGMGPKFMMGMAKLVEPVDLTDYYAKYVSDDKRTAEEMVHDPLNKSHQSALSLIGTMNFISQMPALANQVPKSIPALLIQGGNDQIVNALSAGKVYDALKTSDKTLEEIPGCGHILLGTAFIKPIVLNGTFSWLAKHGGMPLNTGIMSANSGSANSGSATQAGFNSAMSSGTVSSGTASLFSNNDTNGTVNGASAGTYGASGIQTNSSAYGSGQAASNNSSAYGANGRQGSSPNASAYAGSPNNFPASGSNSTNNAGAYNSANSNGVNSAQGNGAPMAPFSQKFKHHFHL